MDRGVCGRDVGDDDDDDDDSEACKDTSVVG